VKFGKAAVIIPDFFRVVSDECFSGAQDGGHAAMAVEGAVVVEGVARVQQPSAAGINGDRCVPASVTGK